MVRRIIGISVATVLLLLLSGCPIPLQEPAPSDNADLSSLTVSEGTINPAFSADTTAYTLVVPNATSGITVTGVAADEHAFLSSNNGSLQSLDEGDNTITLTVTAEDGTIKDYLVMVFRYGMDYDSANIGQLKYVPPGRFQRDETAGNDSVITQPYRMSQYEITRAQFLAVMGSDPSDTSVSSGTSDPVQRVNWYHAIAFSNKLSVAEGLTPVYGVSGISDWAGLAYSSIPTTVNDSWDAVAINLFADGYRLPTEMQWMWAAMGAPADGLFGATNTTGYDKVVAGASGSGDLGNYAWYDTNSGGSTHPVGSKLANELLLYDLSGNVWEWTWDNYVDAASYPTGELIDYSGPGFNYGSHSMKGYGWSSSISSTNRTVKYRSFTGRQNQYNFLGFRVVRP